MFNKVIVKEIRNEITEALEKIAKKHNLDVEVGRITYGLELSTNVKFSEVVSTIHGKNPVTKKSKAYELKAAVEGLPKRALFEEIEVNGDIHKITGYNTRAKAYPIEYTINDKPYKASIGYTKKWLRSARPEYFLAGTN